LNAEANHGKPSEKTSSLNAARRHNGNLTMRQSRRMNKQVYSPQIVNAEAKHGKPSKKHQDWSGGLWPKSLLMQG
jgi:hypothetical protein